MTDNNEKTMTVDRRDALKTLTLLAGYSLTVGATSAFLAGCKADTTMDWKSAVLNSEQASIISEATERILPKTTSPGAKDALVDRYIDEALKNNFTEENRSRFLAGLDRFDQIARDKYKNQFVKLSDENKDDVLKILAEEWKSKKGDYSVFKELRDLTLSGYSTSEIGAKEFFIYDPIPGPYQGCIDYAKVGGTYAL